MLFRSIQDVVASYEPSYLTLGLPHDCATGQFDVSAVDEVLRASVGKDAIAVGPGMGTGLGATSIVHRLLTTAPQPVVVDADALNLLASDQALLDSGRWSAAGPRIITPHPGEFSRVTKLSIGEIEARREEVAVEFAQRMKCVVLLDRKSTRLNSSHT